MEEHFSLDDGIPKSPVIETVSDCSATVVDLDLSFPTFGVAGKSSPSRIPWLYPFFRPLARGNPEPLERQSCAEERRGFHRPGINTMIQLRTTDRSKAPKTIV